MIKRHQHVFHLVAPLEHVLVPVLDGVVDVQELEDPVPRTWSAWRLVSSQLSGEPWDSSPMAAPSSFSSGLTAAARSDASRTLSCPQKAAAAAAAAAAPPRGGALGPQPAERRSAPLLCAGSLPPR